MRQETIFENNKGLYFGNRVSNNSQNSSGIDDYLNKISKFNMTIPRQTIIGIILVIALLSFEIFNFDTTQYALGDLLGEVRFVGLRWATILAIAFCAIDFAGLAHLFTPEQGTSEKKEVWYLMGAWLLGATMNALMTWWAVSLTLISHEFGNEVLSRETLLQVAPIFVAVLVWLTRILFIGAFSVAGDHFFNSDYDYLTNTSQTIPNRVSIPTPKTSTLPIRENSDSLTRPNISVDNRQIKPRIPEPQPRTNSRVQHRPPQSGARRTVPVAMMARSRRH